MNSWLFCEKTTIKNSNIINLLSMEGEKANKFGQDELERTELSPNFDNSKIVILSDEDDKENIKKRPSNKNLTFKVKKNSTEEIIKIDELNCGINKVNKVKEKESSTFDAKVLSKNENLWNFDNEIDRHQDRDKIKNNINMLMKNSIRTLTGQEGDVCPLPDGKCSPKCGS